MKDNGVSEYEIGKWIILNTILVWYANVSLLDCSILCVVATGHGNYYTVIHI